MRGLGVGEGAQRPVGVAFANVRASATGKRLRALRFTRARPPQVLTQAPPDSRGFP